VKLQHDALTSEREIKMQQLEDLKKELQEDIPEKSGAEETRLNLEKILMEKTHLKNRWYIFLEEEVNDEENIRKKSKKKKSYR
jgi:hypothetical protein